MKTFAPVIDEPARGSPGDPRVLALSGKDRILSGIRGYALAPPIHHLTGLVPTSAEGDGRCTFTMPASGWLASSVGPLTGGALAFLADAPLGGAIIAGLGPGWIAITSDLSMSFLRPAAPTGEVLSGHGTLIQAGRSLGLSEVRIQDTRGRLLAHGTSRCFLRHFDTEEVELEEVSPPVYETPDPYLRPVPVEQLEIETLESLSGLQILDAQMNGDLPAPPIALLFGIRLTEVQEGRVVMQIPASRWTMSPAATIYGGATASHADAAMSAAVFSTIPPGMPFATLDLKVNYLRPVLPDESMLEVDARIDHRGKTLAVTSAEIRNAEGKPVVRATGTSVILPGRSWRDPAIVPADEVEVSSEETG